MLENQVEIGGYFEFDLPNLGHFPYPDAIKYNSAQSAFFDLLNQTNIKKIWMPKFICDSMIRPLRKLGIDVQYYDLEQDFYPKLPNDLKEDEYLFYVNYFGLCTSLQKKLLSNYSHKKIIFDHSQAFFIPPFECLGTIYSPRKFLPVAEGGLLISKVLVAAQYSTSRDIAEMIHQYQHCFVRRLSNAPEAYETFKYNEMLLSNGKPKKMSGITEDLLNSLDYPSFKEIRLSNFRFLHSQLKEINQLQIGFEDIESPLTYPLLLDVNISSQLIKNKIFTPTYWLDSLERVVVDSFEYDFISNTTHLICDQRYSLREMQIQINMVKEYL
ncbi:hypothetical protein [Psychrobacter urativorans]|uniref:hypothetical protein n=1 Tax=Psychrobacter urativorans TaxID=45610 RepID=UPI0019192A55|nr:hypothetical protein [Psychrobacter urativorans]